MPDTNDGMTRRGLLAAAGSAGAATLSKTTATGAQRVRLSLNEIPYGPSPLARKVIIDQLQDAFRYVGEEANALRRQVAAFEGVTPDQIILGEILDQLGLHLALIGRKGGEFLYSEPGYRALVDAVEPGGGRAVGVPLNAKLENDLAGFATRIGPETRAIYLINPHNPSGTVSDTLTFLDFLREASRRITVIVDEAYLEFEPDFRERSAVSLVRAGGDVVVFRTFAKIYGLAGLAIGYAIAPIKLATILTQRGLGEPHGLNRLALAAASASLRDGAFVSAARTKVISERTLWHRMLDELGYRHSDSRANFVFFDTRRPQLAFANAMWKEGIEIARPFPPLDTWARISIGLPHENEQARAATRKLLQ